MYSTNPIVIRYETLAIFQDTWESMFGDKSYIQYGLKAVFHFSYVVAKRSVFNCFVNSQAELMIWTQ